MTRLSSDEVSRIFKCLHGNITPPDDLSFKIIVVPSNGMKLSPPSYNFENGLFVLTKPKEKSKKKRKDENAAIELDRNQIEDDPRVPSNLRHLVFSEVLPQTCPWSLSGPQFTRENTSPLQQRYCYPKGDSCSAYSKGAALWTRYDENGREELDFRILHVYHSEKRAKAGNKSAGIAEEAPLKRTKKMPKKQAAPALPSSQSSPARPRSPSFNDDSFAVFDDMPLSLTASPQPLIKDNKIIYALLLNPDPSDNKSSKDSSETCSVYDPKYDFHEAPSGPEENSTKHKYQTQGYPCEYYQSDPQVASALPAQYHEEPRSNVWHGQYFGQSQWSSYRDHQYHSHSTHSSHSIDRGGSFNIDQLAHMHPHMPLEPYPLQQERKRDASVSSSSTLLQPPNINEELRSIHSKLSGILKSDKANQETNRSTLAKWAQNLINEFGRNNKNEPTDMNVEMTSI